MPACAVHNSCAAAAENFTQGFCGNIPESLILLHPFLGGAGSELLMALSPHRFAVESVHP